MLYYHYIINLLSCKVSNTNFTNETLIESANRFREKIRFVN